MEHTLMLPKKKRSGSLKSPTTAPLSRYLVSKTVKSLTDLLLVCATFGENHWDSLLDEKTVAEISEKPDTQEKFLTALCKQPGLPFSDQILDTYLSRLELNAKQRFFSSASLKRRNHPASLCLYGASFCSPGGKNLTKVLDVLIRHGLNVETVVNRNMSDIERAASLGHRELLRIITPHLNTFPEDVIRSIYTKSMHPIESICILIDECAVDINAFMNTKLLGLAKEETRYYVSARMTRQNRIPIQERKEEDSFEEQITRLERKARNQLKQQGHATSA